MASSIPLYRHRLDGGGRRNRIAAEHFRVALIAGRLVKIDHGIVRFARPDPLVERLALCFSDLGVIGRSVERGQRRPQNLQPTRVRLLDQLLMAGDKVFRRWGRVLPSNANVVDANQGAPVEGLATFRRKIDVFGSTVNGFGRAKTAGLPAVIFEGLW
jgi:hypothetical protein